jgi:mannose/cellobiose epimerase-like protein (N-acyl-D-glucosamine 2-epimerase family)
MRGTGAGEETRSEIANVSAEFGSWLRDSVLPQWATRIRHPDGGFADGLFEQGRADWRAPRSLLVQARLAYSFAVAYAGNRSCAWALAAARHALDTVAQSFAAADGGFVRSLASADGPPGDPTRECYDHSFVLLAAAWLYRTTGETAYRALLDETVGFLEASLAHPAGGFRERVEQHEGPRRQNPHMHLFEAFLAAYDATGDAAWLGRAEALFDLFLVAFFDRESGSLVEFFTDDLKPAPGDPGLWRDPGHHFEWVWLLLDYEAKTGDPRARMAAHLLYATAAAYGVRRFPDGEGVIEAMRPDGTPISWDRLLWPQTELVKAQVARAIHLEAPEALGSAADHLRQLRTVHFRGSDWMWANRIDRGGRALEPLTPARVLYHLAFAISAFEGANGPAARP